MAARKALITALLLAAAGPAIAHPESDGVTSGVYAGIRGSYALSGNHVTTWAPTTPATQLRGSLAAGGGRSQSAGAVMNILWDIPMPLEIPIQPFVGMGMGVIHTDLNFAGGGNTNMHQGRWDPAYSMMAGFALTLDETSRLTAMYR